MISSDLRARFEMAFGGICALPEGSGAHGLIEVSANAGVFEKLVKHWQALPQNSRPSLRGLTTARRGGKNFQFLIDAGGKSPFVLLSVEWAGSQALPSLTEIWPYAAWWEDELRSFENAEIAGRNEGAEIAWRQN